ncbi:MAG: LicD family protein [Bacteroidaceae bacterium]|nr:LicD family protein [Bacteroidaceae bacterium]MBR1521190.1 LicD family protein [Bacteroidaceae bacterium]
MRLVHSANYDIKTLQTRLVPILECIDKVCREHHLRYYLWAGTMLGAVRHKGFIPWDDDMDICMPRPDYDTLLAHCHEWMPAPFEVVGPHNRSDYPYPFAKVEDSSTTVIERPDFNFPEGIYIDIFPIDGIATDATAVNRHIRHYKFFRHILFLRGRDPFKHGRGPRSWWPLLIHKLFTLKWLQNKVQDIMTQYGYEECDHVIDHDFNERGIIEKRWMGTPKEYEFEKKTFLGVADADAYLTQMYGDYMTPPPKEKQIQHNFYYLNLELPYREFAQQNGIHIPS